MVAIIKIDIFLKKPGISVFVSVDDLFQLVKWVACLLCQISDWWCSISKHVIKFLLCHILRMLRRSVDTFLAI